MPLSCWLHLTTDQTFKMRYITCPNSQWVGNDELSKLKVRKKVRFGKENGIFLKCQVWWLVISQPLGVQTRNVPHFNPKQAGGGEESPRSDKTRLLRCHLMAKPYNIGQRSKALQIHKDTSFHLKSCFCDLEEKWGCNCQSSKCVDFASNNPACLGLKDKKRFLELPPGN